MELRHLLALDAVLATGSFTAAAGARRISQPALWAQIKELEADLGVALFVRSGRGVTPTSACDALRSRLKVTLDDLAELKRAATEIRQGWDAPARIGCAPSHVSSFLAGCVHALMERDPKTPMPVFVTITSGSAPEAPARGHVDLLVEPRAKAPSLDAARLYSMQIVAVGPAAVAKKRALRQIDVRALDRQPIATMPSDSALRRMLEEAAASAGTSLRIAYESRDPGAILALAEHGLCTAIIPDEMLDEPTARSATRVVLNGRILEAPLWLAWRPEESLSPAARALRDVMRERARRRRRAT